MIRIKELREYNALSQTEFAALTGLTKSTINAYEQGRSQTVLSNIEQIAKACDVSPAWLVGWSDDERPVVEVVKIVGGDKVVAKLEKQVEDLQRQLKSAKQASRLYEGCGTGNWIA